MSLKSTENSADSRRHALLADVAEQVARQLIDKHGMNEDAACDAGNHIADFLSQHWKGQNVYFNSDAQYKMSQRDLYIFQKMERGNAHELAMELGISYVRVYQIYRRLLALARSRSQPGLFEDPAVAAAKLSTAETASE